MTAIPVIAGVYLAIGIANAVYMRGGLYEILTWPLVVGFILSNEGDQ